jgi:hypothetical protein
MATDHHLNANDPLRNPAVDYERADLSAKGVLFFLIGLLVCGVFIELVVWGMFRFLRGSEELFAQGKQNPMVNAQKLPPTPGQNSVLENTPAADVAVFPEPRLQTNDVLDMGQLLASEHQVLYPAQPFLDQTGAIHLPITDAMKLIEQRGLPVRSNAPPADLSEQTDASNTQLMNEQTQSPQQDIGAAERHAVSQPKKK